MTDGFHFTGFDAPPRDFALSPETMTNIGGKRGQVLYVEVRHRIRALRAQHRDWTIRTDLMHFEPGPKGYAVVRAEVQVPVPIQHQPVLDLAPIFAAEGATFDEKRLAAMEMLENARAMVTVTHVTIASAHAVEYAETLPPGLSYADLVQKAETAAIGRALALAGYGTEDAREFDVEETRAAAGRYPGVDSGHPVEAPRVEPMPQQQAIPPADDVLVDRPPRCPEPLWLTRIATFIAPAKAGQPPRLSLARLAAATRDAAVRARLFAFLGIDESAGVVSRQLIRERVRAVYDNDDRGLPTLVEIVAGEAQP